MPGDMTPGGPGEKELSGLVATVREVVARAYPLGLRLTGDESVAGRLPDGSLAAHEESVEALLAASVELALVADRVSGEGRLDALALAAGIERAVRLGPVRGPAGSLTLERHLLFLMPRLESAPEATGAELLDVLGTAPAFIEASRDGCLGSASAEARVALAAAKRLPSILDLLAAGVKASRVPRVIADEIEARLGPTLMAAAEDAGWLVREVMPAATASSPGRLDPAMGVGDLDALLDAAEEILADSQAESEAPGVVSRRVVAWTPEAVATAWPSARAEAATWCKLPPDLDIAMEATPPWLQPLLPPLAPVRASPGTGEPARLLVAPGLRGSRDDLVASLIEILLGELALPAWVAAAGRPARNLVPLPDLELGWRQYALSAHPSLGDWSRDTRLLERRWRSLLAMVGARLLVGALDEETAAEMVRSESGLGPEVAADQVAHVAADPVASLSWVAGVRAVEAAMAGSDPSSRARLLAAAHLPAALVGEALGSADLDVQGQGVGPAPGGQ